MKISTYYVISFVFLLVIISCNEKKKTEIPVQNLIEIVSKENRLITEKELEKITLEELKIYRNEIFARKGYVFKDNKLQHFFGRQEWYIPLMSNKELELSEIEKQNVELIKKYEKALRSNDIP